MQTLKTAIVVVLLLVVFYGVYEMLNRPPVQVPKDVATLDASATADLDIDLGDLGDASGGLPPAPPTGAYDAASFGAPVANQGTYDGGMPVFGGSDPSVTESDTEEVNVSMPEGPGSSVYGSGSSEDRARTQPSPQAPAPPGPDSAYSAPAAPRADASLMAIPGSPQVQHNPYINDTAVPKPEVAGSRRSQIGAQAYQRAVGKAQAMIAEGDLRGALTELSMFYQSPDLSPEQQRELLDILDPLAASVVYSREHILERPYTVGRNETLMDIAQQYQVPYQLLQKINGIDNPNVLLPGSDLKVVRGPFRADVNLQTQELTLFLDRLYAGRFPISLGVDPQPMQGEFQVRDKRPGKAYFSLDGRTIAADSPANPFGNVWLDLGREVCIHGSPIEGAAQQRGCISLSPRDADDVYSILSVGSKVRILR